VIESVEAGHPGIQERLVEGADLRRFINVYVNDEDVRFLSGLATPISDGDVVVVLPAVAGG
jgi:molybdopterin converting factor small subunit